MHRLYCQMVVNYETDCTLPIIYVYDCLVMSLLDSCVYTLYNHYTIYILSDIIKCNPLYRYLFYYLCQYVYFIDIVNASASLASQVEHICQLYLQYICYSHKYLNKGIKKIKKENIHYYIKRKFVYMQKKVLNKRRKKMKL